MPIPANNVTEIPAQAAKTFDTWWTQEFHVTAPDINGSVSLSAVLVKATSRDQEGHAELSDMRSAFSEPNLFDAHIRLPAADVAVGQILDNIAAIRAASPSNTLALVEVVTQALAVIARAHEAID